MAEAAPFGNTLVNARSVDGVEVDLALFGVEPGTFLDPDPDAGDPLTGDGQVVLARSAETEDIAVGETVVLQPSGQELSVAGFLEEQHTFGHVDVG